MRKLILSFLLLFVLVFPAAINAETTETTYTNWDSEVKKSTDLQKVWTIHFNKQLNEQSIERNIKLINSSNAAVPITTSVSEDLKSLKVHLAEGQQYKINEEYRLFIGPGITSLNNQPLSENIQFDFIMLEEMTETSTIESIDHEFVHLANGDAIHPGEFSTIFNKNNAEVLKNAEVSIVIKDNTITSIEALKITASGETDTILTLDGNNTTINGSLIIDGDYLAIKNLVVQEDFTVSKNVKNVLELDTVTVNGTTSIQDNQTAAAASFTTSANPSVTKLTLKFNNSKFVTLEIYKQDTDITATGASSFTYVKVASNTSIHSDPDIIMPKIEITEGVTKIELNTTVAEMDIKTTEALEISGSGNFDRINVNTAKEVHLNVTGNIQNLEVQNEQAKVTINENAFVGDVTVPEGANKDDMIIVGKEQVGELPEPDEHYAVGLLREKHFGPIATLNIKNPEPYTVKYIQIQGRELNSLPDVGEKAPKEAVVYHGEDIQLWRSHYVVVFLVDSNNTIIKRDDLRTDVHIQMDVSGNYLVVNLFVKDPSENVADTIKYFAYYKNREFVILDESDFANMSWKKEGIHHLLYIPISNNIASSTDRIPFLHQRLIWKDMGVREAAERNLK